MGSLPTVSVLRTTYYLLLYTEWFATIGEEAKSNAFREEDNRKIDRLEILFQEIGLSYERSEPFEATDLFFEYNRQLPNYFSTPASFETTVRPLASSDVLRVSIACRGIARGRVRIVTEETLLTTAFDE